MKRIAYKIKGLRKHYFPTQDAAAEFASVKFMMCEKDKNYLKQYGVFHRPDYDIEIQETSLRAR